MTVNYYDDKALTSTFHFNSELKAAEEKFALSSLNF